MRNDETAPVDVSAQGLRVAVVTATFNATVTAGLKEGALTFLESVDAREIRAIDVPGAFELPLVALELARSGYDAVVCLGAVIEGDTDHYEHVAHRASEGIMRVQLDTGVPVTFGVLTVRNVDDALARAHPGPDNKGREAAHAAVVAARTLETIRSA
jgi:6,7-dimethyl-8-ribityllumazine synthase